jgi:hypothetical protein
MRVLPPACDEIAEAVAPAAVFIAVMHLETELEGRAAALRTAMDASAVVEGREGSSLGAGKTPPRASAGPGAGPKHCARGVSGVRPLRGRAHARQLAGRAVRLPASLPETPDRALRLPKFRVTPGAMRKRCWNRKP